MCLLEEMYIASSANLVQSVILFCIKALTFLCFQRIGEFKTGVWSLVLALCSMHWVHMIEILQFDIMVR